ncbi:pimeloyl-ACP methyl ester carboxylesterase [Flavobacterium sp. 1]|uniref:alpha/beta fold hydrolase n=1 Tax=Flavobacterium sp. 1 TaxID=2035200 RepID=UPI000C24657D|nr:alpha/beta hydrolase [Flavobacterium sp. 1]PJJ07263.1 pimeloyl-ACP methyl ester carboxylesterase [Flavobacterium sp. 1]
MKKYSLSFIILVTAFTNVFSQTNNSEIMTFQNVKTETISVNGTKFYYRKLGILNESVPVIFLNHLGATLDNCDPRILDGIASKHQIIAFDNRGVGATEGKTPITIAEMAKDAIGFIKAMGYEKVDIVGFSMGAFIAQEILLQEPQLVRRVVMTGTGPAGGEGIKNVSKITYWDMLRGYLTFRDPKFYLFFNQNENGKKSAKEFLARIKERTENRDEKINLKSFSNQLKAIHSWGLQKPQDLSVIKQPVLIANGDNDRMVPSSNTYDLAKRISNSELIVYKDAGHGGIFQNHVEFVKRALTFLAK